MIGEAEEGSGIPVSTIVRARTAPAAAVVLGVVALGLGAASVVLDSLTHRPQPALLPGPTMGCPGSNAGDHPGS
jgi:hypothetical protein